MANSRQKISLGGLVFVLSMTSVSWAQGVPINDPSVAAGNTASENAASSARRSPGIMVIAGVARALTAIPTTITSFNVVETERPTPLRVAFLVEAIDIIFSQLNEVISLFGNLLRIRAGDAPLLTPGLLSALGSDATRSRDSAAPRGNSDTSQELSGSTGHASDRPSS